VKIVVVGAATGLGGALAHGLGGTALELVSVIPPEQDGVAIVVGADPAPVPGALTDTSPGTWRKQCDEVLLAATTALQRARQSVAVCCGRLVVITPTVGLSGSPSLVPYTTAIEGVRALAKSAARQWGREGVRLNLVAVPMSLIAPGVTVSSHLTPPAVRDADALLPTLIGSVRFLLGTDAPALSGATIVADGGSVMVP
jgi:3-oxoacyl-[acyl-carrier protein] reductase